MLTLKSPTSAAEVPALPAGNPHGQPEGDVAMKVLVTELCASYVQVMCKSYVHHAIQETNKSCEIQA